MTQAQKPKTSRRTEQPEIVHKMESRDLELLKKIEELIDEVEEVLEENDEVMSTKPQCATCPCGFAPEDCLRWRAGDSSVRLTVKGPDYWSFGGTW